MKIPKRINELLSQKQDYIDMHRARLEKTVIDLQSRLLDKLIVEIIPELDVKDGLITDSNKNYRMLSSLDKVYKSFTEMSSNLIAGQMSSVTSGLIGYGKKYFSFTLTKDLGTRFEKIIDATAKKMNLRIGLEGGQMVRGGFMESFLKDQTLGTQIKNFISKSVTGQIDTKEFLSGLTDLVKGVPKLDGNGNTIQSGALEKQFQRYGYDLYQSYDRAYGNTLAQEFDMNFFIYQGGLISDSRDFCVCHNNRVWTREEAATWTEWKPIDGEYPAGYEVKQKDIYSHPSYMDYTGYQPLIDAGGYNCRHSIGWISEELAFDLRPNLKPKE